MPRGLAKTVPTALLLGLVTLLPSRAEAQAEPGPAKHHRLTGEQLMLEKDFAKAIQSFDKALDLFPDYYLTLYNRGVCKHKLGKLDEALKDYDRTIYHVVGFKKAYKARAQIYVTKGKLDVAVRDLSEAILLDPKDMAAYADRALVLIKKGSDDEAIADLTEAIRLAQDKGEEYFKGYWIRGMVRFRLDRLKKARADYRKVRELQPWIAQGYLVAADIEARLGNLGQSVEHYTHAIEIGYSRRPSDGLPHYNLKGLMRVRAFTARGRTRWLNGDKKGGLADLAKANKLDKSFVYPPIWEYGLGGESSVLDKGPKAPKKGQEWEFALLRFARGQLTADGLLGLAKKAEGETTQHQRLCQAYCFIGLLAERAGKPDEAKRLYKQSFDLKVTTFGEYFWAKTRFAQLSKKS